MIKTSLLKVNDARQSSKCKHGTKYMYINRLHDQSQVKIILSGGLIKAAIDVSSTY